jgi:DMSO reductase anchor subunit
MKPALSVIFFTTVAGAGYGLLFWAGLLGAIGVLPPLPWFGPAAVLTALVLASAGLIASTFHLGRAERAWRAISQWRTSWLSREGVASLVTYLPALGFALVWGLAGEGAAITRALGALSACAAIVTVVCTAMIYASLKPIPAWGHRLVLPGYLGFALLCGGLLLAALQASQAGAAPSPAVAKVLLFLAAALGALKLHYWRSIDAAAMPATRGDAVGLPGRTVSVFERPHTEASYITREMAFVVARAHAERLRGLALLLFAVAPIACVLLIGRVPGIAPAAWLWLAAIAALAGAFVERWLFFAQARHVVTLYY